MNSSLVTCAANQALAGLLLLAVRADADDATALPPAAPQKVDFAADVYPLLSKRCFPCHQGPEASSGRRLDDRRELLGETNGLPLVRPGRSAESRLIRLVAAGEAGLKPPAAGTAADLKMPPQGERLTAAEVGLLRAWIDQGLTWDETLLPPVLSQTDHWAFQPVKRPQVPTAGKAGLEPPAAAGRPVRNPVDAFIAAKQQELGLRPAPEASRRTLIRRLSLDLLGLPPTLEQVENFVNDESPHAYDRLVARLLESPHYGERWGRHWLDVARWAESEGYESNHPRPFAWRYRDYVVDSFNNDRPYDEFVRQQLAGDELQPYSDENVIATGFLAAARISSNEEDKWLQRNDVDVDIVNATAAAFLGLTINCAQCHNHKFDPISTRDYYRLQGYFVKGQPVVVALQAPRQRREYESQRPDEYEPAVKLAQAIFHTARRLMIADERSKLSSEELHALDAPADRRTLEQELLARRVSLNFQRTSEGIEKYIPEHDRRLYVDLKRKIGEIEKGLPALPQTFAYYSPVTSPHRLEVLPSPGFYPLPFEPAAFEQSRPYLKIRGDVHAIGPTVDPGWPEVFDTVFDPSIDEARQGTRLALAEWLTDPRHPLTARVWVNRIWHYHFGRGIVATPGDFGLAGAKPTHPQLLDWLAAELVESGWSTKHIQRLIVTSSAYRQSSRPDAASAAIDPDNAFLWHWEPRRLENEIVRDAMLAVTGELDATTGGPGTPIAQREKSVRRSLYQFQQRGLPPEMQKLFDGPAEASESCSRRHTSTTSLQSLYLLNNQFVLDRAEKLADRLRREVGDDRQRQIEAAFLWTLSRQPDDDELQAAARFLAGDDWVTGSKSSWPRCSTDGATQSLTPRHPSTALSPLTLFCQVLLNLNEFVYVE